MKLTPQQTKTLRAAKKAVSQVRRQLVRLNQTLDSADVEDAVAALEEVGEQLGVVRENMLEEAELMTKWQGLVRRITE